MTDIRTSPFLLSMLATTLKLLRSYDKFITHRPISVTEILFYSKLNRLDIYIDEIYTSEGYTCIIIWAIISLCSYKD